MSDDDTHTLEEFMAGIAGETGRPLQLQIVTLADLRVELRGAAGHEPAANVDYQAHGPVGNSLAGTTDADGRLAHPGVPSGTYRLTVGDLQLDVPTVQRGGEPHVRWISKHPRSK
jgi:hypothetical protein